MLNFSKNESLHKHKCKIIRKNSLLSAAQITEILSLYIKLKTKKILGSLNTNLIIKETVL
jgi:hypothetical protein